MQGLHRFVHDNALDSSVPRAQPAVMPNDTFYWTPFACSLVSHVVLHETGHPHDAVALPTSRAGAGDDAYAAINPARTVPVLATADGTLTQSTAILVHLAERYPERGLLPTTAGARGDVLSALAFATSDIHPGFRPFFQTHRLGDDPTFVQRVQDASKVTLAHLFAILDDHLGDRPFLGGDRMSIADPYVLVFALWTGYLGLPYPARLAALASRLRERPAVQRVLGIEQAERARRS
jgi:glutathione S-transferase